MELADALIYNLVPVELSLILGTDTLKFFTASRLGRLKADYRLRFERVRGHE
jgi:hypothetical protein